MIRAIRSYLSQPGTHVTDLVIAAIAVGVCALVAIVLE